MEARIEALEHDVTEIKVEVATIKASYVPSAQFSEMQERVTHIEARLDQIEARLHQIEKRMDQLETQLDRIEEEITELRLKIQKMEHDIEAIKLAIERQSEEMSKMRSELISRMDTHFDKYDARTKTWLIATTISLVAMQTAMLGILVLK